jgi:sulfonate transport system substrate-binding protein
MVRGGPKRRIRWWVLCAWIAVPGLVAAACAPGEPVAEPPEVDPDVDEPAEPEEPVEPVEPDDDDFLEVRAGYVSGVDQMGLPAALDLGFFEDHNLDVEIVSPFPTGVDALAALEAGEADIVQVGVPSFGAILRGMDVVYLGNYSGSAVTAGIDETMAIVAREGSEIDPADLTTLRGKSIAASIGTINHLYLLGVLEAHGVGPDEVDMVNTPPPEMPVALETASVDAISVWDPWPIIALQTVEGTFEVSRGGGYISYIGFVVALRDFAEANPEILTRFLAARAAADQYVRDNPDEGADIVVRWFPGTDPDVAQEAMQYNIRQLDPRMSACNYLGVYRSLQLLEELEVIDGVFDPNDHFMPDYIVDVERQYPEYFDDLDPVPDAAQIDADYVFDPAEAEQACPE